MRIQVLQHVPFEGPAAIGHWAVQRGVSVGITRLFAGEPLPPLEAADLLVVLGGPMSVNDEARFAWLAPEKRHVRQAIERGKRVLGVCLGAQLIAHALGARVYANAEREIGWWPVHRVGAGSTHPLMADWPEHFLPLHWHGETFDLPPGAVWLARSDVCAHQAFAVGEGVLGLQFHLESTRESVDALARNCPADLAAGAYVQSAEAMLAHAERFHESNQLMAQLLDAFTRRLTG